MARGRTLRDAEVGDAEGRDDEVVDAELVDWPEDAAVDTADAVEADPLQVAQAERDEYLDSLRRLQAEFENYKKRVLKQQAEQVARAAAGLVDKLLPVLDALDLATDHVGDADSAEGKALVAASGLLHGVLAKEGLERIDPLGEEFDPNAHEAVGQVPAPEGTDPTASGEPRVAQVMRAGYRWHGTVVRPAMVMVEG
jgi:molecular chaperone GrpE